MSARRAERTRACASALVRGFATTCLLVLLHPAAAHAWGLGAHRWVALRAAELAEARCGDLVRARGALADYAVEPDTILKARDGRRETVRHFLDLDHYGAPPFRALSRSYAEAVACFGRATVEENGTLPWEGGRLARRLADELGRRDLAAARRTAGYLAHYAADATMPLHATENHDGQLTGQRGLHRRIEAKLVDARLRDYVRAASAVPSRRSIPPGGTEGALFAALETAYAAVGDVLRADRVARRDTRVGSEVYYRRLDREIGARLATQLGAAAALTAALWDGACAADEGSAERR